MIIQVACVVSRTSIFLRQMIVIEDFFLSAGLNGLVQIEQLVALLYSLHCSLVSHFIGILLARCCLQMVAVARTQLKNFSAVSSPMFTWGGSKH